MDQFIAVGIVASLTAAAVWVAMRILSRDKAPAASALAGIATALGLFLLLRRRGRRRYS